MYTEKTFEIPDLRGISQKTIKEHLGLYAGYVKNTNMILAELENESLSDYIKAELGRRFSFEYNGMKNHEYYFQSLVGGTTEIPEGILRNKIEEKWNSFENFISVFTQLAKTRGVGWAVLAYDKDADALLLTWIDEQHLGHLNSTQYVVGIDMWEHAFVADYQPSGKGDYIDDYLSQVNWEHINEEFEKTAQQ
ncbi:MAG: Fe-Mn family superoxide dismutase [Flavobacteriaceae bacterium]|jgi:Fe-Mn family superoxide dismutase